MDGIIKSNAERDDESKIYINPDKIAENYLTWLQSPPFDIGFTTKAALNALRSDATFDSAYAASQANNQKS